ncbi:MAG: 4Fe-4S dicluster domain-containing protein [Oligoflexia bacterium]|nr:4Fe-4S dicluster domain-containing protein [Oligoflexia bacterium]
MNKNSGKDETSTFVPPRHWLGPEELEASYWADPQVAEKRSQEFYEKPVELIDAIDKTDTQGLARREFLTIMGASMAMATLSCARRPVHKIIPHVVRPEEVVPGVSSYYASTCKECSVGCGILTKNREGRPIKLEGNSEHPANRGALCAQGQASLLNLYDPDRLQAPYSKSKGQLSGTEISWETADAQIAQKLKASGRVRVLTGTVNSPSTQRLINEFLGGFKDGKHVVYDPLSLGEISDAQEASYGTNVTPKYYFDKAEFVVSFGADFLGNWLSPVEHSRDWGQGRRLDSKNPANAALRFSKLVVFESIFSVTGANADERYPVRPGDEYRLAMALAYELIVSKKLSRFASDSAVIAALQGYKPEVIAAEIGIEGGAEKIRALAEQLWRSRGKGLVVGGGISTRNSSAHALQVVVNLLNSALENEGVTVAGAGVFAQPGSTYAGLAALIEEMRAGRVDALIVHRTNPAFTTPRTATGLEEAMKKVSLVVSVADHADETSRFADYVLADHHYLENWGDGSAWHGVYSLQQPAIAPLYSTRAFEDTLIAWAKGAQLKVSSRLSGAADWHAYLMDCWNEIHQSEHIPSGFQQFWETCLRDGVYTAKANSSTKASARAFRSASVSALTKFAPAAENEMRLALYESIALGDGTSANNPWLQEFPDPISSITWDNYLNIGVAAAKRLGLAENDVVEIQSADVALQLPVHIQPGMHPASASVAIGYGRRSVGKVGNLAGVDVFPLVKAQGNELVYAGLPMALTKTGKFYKLAATQYHTASENRPIINDISLAQFIKNPGAVNETEPELKLKEIPTIFPRHDYKGYRWGMSIDLTQCFGCGACVIACQAENNIPVVGREQVRNSRQMHWIRIDRYFSGTPEKPEVVFQPMLCQHCENAPCETVCPVLATVHDDEGLNVQVYNRCVGTRYCQNNCPYKVRRFNFFDHWKSYEGSMNLAWNPDVTVRSRGIMEKCTFCVQRIRDAKDQAKDAGTLVEESSLKTACQQTCPTDAIVFGDINNPATKVSHRNDEQRTFRALEVLNTRPAVSYMTKVRNVERAETQEANEAKEGAHS